MYLCALPLVSGPTGWIAARRSGAILVRLLDGMMLRDPRVGFWATGQAKSASRQIMQSSR